MSLTWLGLPAFLFGLAALAAGLYVLQQLRVRHRELVVPTTRFWDEALEEARARVLRQRFRHPLAYLFLLLLAALLWLGVAGPRLDQDAAEDTVVLCDASALSGGVAGLEARLEAAGDFAATLPEAGRRVLLCGASATPLLLPGEPVSLLGPRLEGVAPEVAPPSVEAVIARLARDRDQRRPLRLVVVGDTALDEAALADLGPGCRVERLPVGSDATGTGPVLVALGQAPARDGAGLELLAGVELAEGMAEPAVAARVDGADLGAPDRVERDGGVLSLRWDGVPASGGRVELTGLPLPAALRLADAAPLLVAVAADAPAACRELLAADPGLRLAGAGEAAEVAVTVGAASGLPSLVLADAPGFGFRVTVPAGDRRAAREVDAFRELGLADIDRVDGGEALATDLVVTGGDARRVEVDRRLLSDSFDWTRSPGFPLFVARALRYLADRAEAPPYLAAGEPLRDAPAPLAAPGGAVLDPLGDAFVPPRSGGYAGAGGRPLEASLQRPAPVVAAAALPEAEAGLAGGAGPLLWIPGLALLLLLVEWFLYRGGRLP
ncbi:MAG: BatA domain-containing protein [Planctomycetota bacterium]